VIDARDWHVITKLPAPDRIANIGVGSYGMAVSADGRYVYIHKWKILTGQYRGSPRTDHWWDIFDTKTQQLTDNSPHVPDCGEAKAFPPMNTSSALAILCFELNALVFIDPRSGQVTRSISTYDAASCYGDAVGATQAPGGTIYLVTKNGCIRTIDPVEMTVRNVFREDLPGGWLVPYDLVALSPSGDRLLLGVGPASDALGHEVWVIDVETQSRISTIQLEQTASSLTTSPDGRVLYTVRRDSNDLAALDAGLGRQLWLMTNLAAPWVVRSAPRP
jgi:DNA-binding beta-propeller fold protein YncE